MFEISLIKKKKKYHTLKIIKGTIIKYDNHPIRLAKAIYIKISEDRFDVNCHNVLIEEDLEREKHYIDEDEGNEYQDTSDTRDKEI